MTNAVTYPAGTPSWIDLMTPIPAQTHEFYAGLFGWDYEVRPQYGNYAMASRHGKSAAGIMPMEPGAQMPSAWTVYFASDDLAADAERVRELGGSAMMGPHQVGDQGHMAVFADPTGAAFGLWQAGQHRGAQATDGEGSLAWVQVNTPDSARASAFYEALFHASSSSMEGMDYRQLQHGEQPFAGVSGMMPEGAPPHWIAYFYASDVDATVKRAQEHGGKALGETLDTPFGRMALLADPAGAAFWVMNPEPTSA
ncbi:VOC family protein [Deinococcus sp.]|uniref:VOC family protein n=1 Tax=Deinococcus sp. TaxID=47478 RepID=UPI003CC59F97